MDRIKQGATQALSFMHVGTSKHTQIRYIQTLYRINAILAVLYHYDKTSENIAVRIHFFKCSPNTANTRQAPTSLREPTNRSVLIQLTLLYIQVLCTQNQSPPPPTRTITKRQRTKENKTEDAARKLNHMPSARLHLSILPI